MDFSVVVFDELFDEGTVLVQDFVPHVGDVVQDGLVFDHEVLLERRPAVHRRDWVDRVDDLDGDRLDLAVVVLGLSPPNELRVGRGVFRAHPAEDHS